MRDFVIVFGIAIGITFLFHHLRIAPIVGYLIAKVLLGLSMPGIVDDVALIETLAEAMLRTKYGVTVLAIRRGGEMITNVTIGDRVHE